MKSTKTKTTSTIILGKSWSNQRRIIAFLAIAIVYFFYCYNFMLSSFVRPTMIKEVAQGGFGFTLQDASAIFSIMSFATIPGTLFWGMITTKIGKKFTLILVALSIMLFTFLPLLSPTTFWLWQASRFMAGLALGGVFGTAVPLVAEMFETKYRGKLAAILTSTFSLAIIFSGQLYGLLGDANWTILVWTAVIPPLIGAILVYFLVPNDRELVLERQAKIFKKQEKKVNFLTMYQGKYLWIGIGVILLSGFNFTAYSAFANNSTTYLRTVLKISAANAGSIYSMLGIGLLIGYNFWGLIADKFGRRIPLIGMALASFFIFIYINLGAQDILFFHIIQFMLGITIGFSGAWGAWYTELFPKRFSGLAAGISFNGGRIISSIALPLIAGLAAGAWGISVVFYVAIIIFALGAGLWFFLPETLNKPRE